MAVFNQRAELSKQKRHQAAEWDDDFGLKLLGFKETGERNLWGKAFMGAVPGLNTGSHAIAKKRAGGSTKEALDSTFDEAVSQDFAGLAFGAEVAKTIFTGGAGGMMGGAGGAGGMMGGGGGMMSMFGKGGANAAGAASAAGNAAGAVGGATQGAEEIAGMASGGIEGAASSAESAMNDAASGVGKGGFFNKYLNKAPGTEEGSDVSGMLNKVTGEVAEDTLQNPFEQGTDEYESFERQRKTEQKDSNKDAFSGGVKTLGKSLSGKGNLLESGANLAASGIASYKAKKNAYQELRRGSSVSDSNFNYL